MIGDFDGGGAVTEPDQSEVLDHTSRIREHVTGRGFHFRVRCGRVRCVRRCHLDSGSL